MCQWWIEHDAAKHSVLDGAPSHGFGNAGCCDLMLCQDDQPAGVVEVEGTQPLAKLHTIGQYFASARGELSSLRFGILLSYAYQPRGRGAALAYANAEDPIVMKKAIQLSLEHPGRTLYLVFLDKAVDTQRSSIRSTRNYYFGSLLRATAVVLKGGNEVGRALLFDAAPAGGAGRAADRA